MERLAPAVLLVLFDGVPAVVHIEEPRQGIQFGVRLDPEDPPASRRAKVHVRDCNTGATVPPANDFTPDNSVDVPFRPGAPGVINIARAAPAPGGEGAEQRRHAGAQRVRAADAALSRTARCSATPTTRKGSSSTRSTASRRRWRCRIGRPPW